MGWIPPRLFGKGTAWLLKEGAYPSVAGGGPGARENSPLKEKGTN